MDKDNSISIPTSCSECEFSRITLVTHYLQCELTGYCYIPEVMTDKISEECPLINDRGE